MNSATNLISVSSMDNGLSRQEQLKTLCCKPSYKLRRLKNRGAIMLLVWNHLVVTMYRFNQDKSTVSNYGIQFDLELVAGGLTLVFAGWLADVHFGRYKMIRFSMWVMWLAYLLATASGVIAKFVSVSAYITQVFLIIASMGLAMFQANIIQFGIDQLHDASTNEITSFIIWYVWTYCSSLFVALVVFNCLPKKYELLKMLVMCTYFSVALCLLLLYNNLLVKEPVTQNPFKLVYTVIKYAIKIKHPQRRSAFTYCEDELPSRIDFGKSKYGGPFTTEQVEDVKTFLRLVAIITIISILLGETTALFTLTFKLFNMLFNDNDRRPLQKCYLTEGILDIFLYSWVFTIPIYEYIIYPLFHRLLINIKSLRLVTAGVVFLIVNILSHMIIEIEARNNFQEQTKNSTLQCKGHGLLSASLDYRWMILPYTFYSLSVGLIGIGTIQFIAAQSPYSMRGLIMGATYGLFLLLSAVGIAISTPFVRNLSVWGTGIISCGFWHSLMLLVVGVAAGVLLLMILWKYKGRKREDVLPSEHIFAERYYEKDS